MLIVTAFCNNEVPLLLKKAEWMKQLGIKPTHDILFMRDMDVVDSEFAKVTEAYKDLFVDMDVRKITDYPLKSEWPWTVNHVFRNSYRTVRGIYGETFNSNKYASWFYFEPDITPLHKDLFTTLEHYYGVYNPIQTTKDEDGKDITYRNYARPYMGYINNTKMSNGTIVRHMNGGGVYPNTANMPKYALLMDGLPWDVAGLTELHKIGEIPANVYIMAFGSTFYKKIGDNKYSCKQNFMNGDQHNLEIEIESTHMLHHGCKDGSLIDCLENKTMQNIEEINVERHIEIDNSIRNKSIIEDFKNNISVREIKEKYSITQKELNTILREAGLK